MTATKTDTARAFRLTLTPGRGDTYGLVIEETYGDNGHTLATKVLTTTAAQTGRVVDAVLTAVRTSGHSTTALAFNRKRPIRLNEAAGVRLTLTLMATQPITKHERIRAVVAGVNAMSVEETYYWYAKCFGPGGGRARKALRVLLADD
ncbi:hypothetical protein KZX45_08170 [Georgenia sp. EYE_87]|uniref:DUF7680 family protein n=1 Tax=Georgenia sp. EYE_87 TaxID=2853448 RepID=UPI0020046260|nr:hypothetical protein [Georgenia sp. EYE_87]MCK6210516.1 hypothetical protein [Georgenia sp. EYE_87]